MYTVIIILTLVGFLALAAVLLLPVYRFIKREERASRQWTPERTAADPDDANAETASSTNGAATEDGRRPWS